MSTERSTSTPMHDFWTRHIGPSESDVDAMLTAIGIESLDTLIDQAVPESIRIREPLDMPGPRTEPEVAAALRRLGDKNDTYISMLGQGYYGTHTPAVIQRNILENPGWYTAYTPYQPEISQGRLEALLNFQTVISDLTGMEIANASMLDEATAAAEAMALLRRTSRSKAEAFFVDARCHRQTIEVIATRAEPIGIELIVGDPAGDLDPESVFGALLQYPGTDGSITDYSSLISDLKDAGVGVAVAADLLALILLRPPGEMGADVVVGSSQRFGVPMMFGGPHAGYMAIQEDDKRNLPGRLVGVSKDSDDRPALRLALATREQHIRREKATSNICTAQVLLAVMAGMYAVYHGPDGLRRIASGVHAATNTLAAALRSGGFELRNQTWFDTLTIATPDRADDIVAAAAERTINLWYVDPDTVALSVDETTTPEIIDAVLESFGVEGTFADFATGAPSGLPEGMQRTSEYLTHPVFSSHRSETEMLRYMRKLQQNDIALDRAMIPLGSCTMKLNATTEMVAVTWPEFAGLHPYVPLEQAEGYLELITELEGWLAELTGYDAVSLQPNAGSQGELAGLLAIRGYHHSRDEGHRDVCLIPASAHGTNPASAAMAGLRVVVVKTDEDGNIDLADLTAKAEEHADQLAALMITYPSTHGVFEDHVRDVCQVVHDNGGQVYVDGANLNALLGVAKPGEFGGDVSHLNLHKTFTIPHGGGGPGVGPIGVKSHLEPFLPGHPLVHDQEGSRDGVGAVAAAPWGSAGILPIPWAYIALMGGEGLTKATHVAILNANYIAARLRDHYPILYTGENGLVAHECIIDLRPIKAETGVTVDDVAKRLIDFGFHAPTMSFPVAGTLMIEPTESESRRELDRFCEAMILIKDEIETVRRGDIAHEDSPLYHAPHTAEEVISDKWDRAYPREQGAYPVDSLRDDKYWPPVGRVDNSYGDRNIMCSCPPIEAYA